MKKLTSLALSSALAMTMLVPAQAAPQSFSDATQDFWAYQEINLAVEKGITNGYQDGTFRPAAKVTNAHFEAFIARAFYANEVPAYDSDPWYSKYSNVLAKHGVPNHTTLTSDFPKYIHQPINRYDMAMVMFNVLNDQNGEMPSQQDVEAAQQAIGDWKSIPQKYQSAVATCYALGLLNGQADGNFGGNNLMNRAQACVVINRLSNFISAPADKPNVPDKPSVPDKPVVPNQPDVPSVPDKPNKPAGELQPGQYDVNVHDVPADTNKDGFITEEEVQAVLARLREEYPSKTSWDDSKEYYSNAFHSLGSGCAAWAFFVSDQIFGKTLPVSSTRNIRSIKDAANFKSGDICSLEPPHWFVFTSDGVDANGIYTTCGGNEGGGLIDWSDYNTLEEFGDESDLANDTSHFVYYSRYPQ